MTGVQTVAVTAEEADLRLDRWFRRHFPALGHGRLEKLLRTGQVRVDGKRARSNARLSPGQMIRVPPLDAESPPGRPAQRTPPRKDKTWERDVEALRRAMLYRDADVLAIDKPAGLAVQGGTGTHRHLDALLDGLRFDAAERPRLVHRLDKDTSGVLLLARNARSAAELTEAFRHKDVRKLYWAVVVGVPKLERGRIDLDLSKQPGSAGERVAPDLEGQGNGKRAITFYRVVEHIGKQAAWLALMPLTGRTHQLRAHCAAIGTPILGDGKYGGADAFLPGKALPRQLHLHARAIELPRPGRKPIRVTAPLPPHMAETWRFFGFESDPGMEPLTELDLA
ncbi:RluA family pseudouridine synthase [Rhodospirillaceae bacterium SYSU D60014]|uniref:RluA family pseudouridine synthase n=1 Tax=Virgifigura deserti TaxID=2268457 RepID=UPI000E66A2D9